MSHNYLWSVIAAAVSAAASFLAIPILINHFGSADFGEIAQFYVLIALLPLLELGLIQSFIQFLSARKEYSDLTHIQIGGYFALGGGLVAIVIVVVLIGLLGSSKFEFLAGIFDSTDSTTFLIVAIICARILIPVFSLTDYVDGRVVRLSMIGMLSTIIRTCGLALISHRLDFSLEAYLFGYLAVSVTEMSLYIALRARDSWSAPPESLSLSGIISRPLFYNAVKIWILVISWNGLMQFERIVLSSTLPSSQFGIIWAASSLAAAVMLVCGPLNGFVLPRLNRVSEENLSSDFYKVAHTYALFIFLPACFALLYQKEIFHIWLDIPVSADVKFVFSLYLAGNLVHILAGFAYFLRYRFGISTRFLIGSLVFTLCQCIAIYVASRFSGAIGTSTIWFLSSVLAFLIFAVPKFNLIDGGVAWVVSAVGSKVIPFGILLMIWKFVIGFFIDNILSQLLLGGVGLVLFILVSMWRGRSAIYR